MTAGRSRRCTIVACGERWTSVADEPDGLRPSVEDLLGAGAIAAAITGLSLSPEAEVAVAAWESAAPRIETILARCVSGRELIERGFPDDVALAARVDTTSAVPRWDTSSDRREFSA